MASNRAWIRYAYPLLVAAVALLIMANDRPALLNNIRLWYNLMAIVPIVGMIALGQTILLRVRHLDPSIGAMAILVAAAAGKLMLSANWPWIPAVVAGLACAAVGGSITGFVASRTSWTPALGAGVLMFISVDYIATALWGDTPGIKTFGTPGYALLVDLENKTVGLFTWATLLFFASLLVLPYVASRRPTGDRGMHEKIVPLFVLASILGGISGVFYMSRSEATVFPSQADALFGCAAAVIGGGSVFGRSGGVMSVVLGSLVVCFLEIETSLFALNILQRYLVLAAVFVGALLLDVAVSGDRASAAPSHAAP